MMEFSPGLVVIAGDAAGEALARHRETGELTLAPWIGVQADWVVLGATFIDGLRRMHRGEVFDPPRWSDLGRPVA